MYKRKLLPNSGAFEVRNFALHYSFENAGKTKVVKGFLDLEYVSEKYNCGNCPWRISDCSQWMLKKNAVIW